MQEFFLKILIREWNFWQAFSVFLSPNIEILVCQKNVWLSAINDLWYQNQYVTFWGQKALKFCYKSCLIIILVESFFHMKFCVYVLRILVNNVILLCQNIACIVWLYYCILLLLWTSCQQVTTISILLFGPVERFSNWLESISDIHHFVKREY